MKKKARKNKKRSIIAFTIADEKNMKYFDMLNKSFHYFHPDIELKLLSGKELEGIVTNDPQFYYRATPVVAWNLLSEYETVVKIDADSIITGDISHTWKGDFDVAVVNNSNPRELKNYPVNVWNIHPLSYVNAGYVVMKSFDFVDHWLGLCASDHFNHYQMREQDLLNIMVFYMNDSLRGQYKVKFLDGSPYAHGLVTKGYWADMKMNGKDIVLPPVEGWNQDEKIVKILHAAGGNVENKWNFNLQFDKDVVKRLEELTQ